jgi:hypothetical protein
VQRSPELRVTRQFFAYSENQFDDVGLLKPAKNDQRMNTNARNPGKDWYSFQLTTDADLLDALYSEPGL